MRDAVHSSLVPLRIPAFRRLATSYTLNEFADWFGAIALAILVYDETRDPLATSALFMASKFLPAFVAQLVTARVDQLATRRALPALYVGEAAAFFILAATTATDFFFLPLILALALVDGTLALSGRALTRAAAALVLEPAGQLREGNALINIGFAVASAAGPALAGFVVAGTDVFIALGIAGAFFLAMAWVIRGAVGLPDAHPEPEHWRRRMRDGLAYIRGNRAVRRLVILQSVALIFFSAILPIEVIYAKQTLNVGDAGFGALLAAWGGGMVLGSVIFTGTKHRSTVLLISLSTAAVGTAYLGMAGADSLLVACVLSVLGGAGNGVQWVAVVTALQEATSAAYQARVAAMFESMAAAMPGIGFILGGAITSLVSTRAAYAAAGTGVLIVALVVLLSRRRHRASPSTGDGPPLVASRIRDPPVDAVPAPPLP